MHRNRVSPTVCLVEQQWQTKGLPGGADMALKVIVGQGGPSGTGMIA
jgi:hypothetical protein